MPAPTLQCGLGRGTQRPMLRIGSREREESFLRCRRQQGRSGRGPERGGLHGGGLGRHGRCRWLLFEDLEEAHGSSSTVSGRARAIVAFWRSHTSRSATRCLP